MATTEMRLSIEVKRPILACGADLKGAFAVAKGKRAVLFDGFGDLADLDNFTRYEAAIKREARKLKPAVIACDMHPGYFSTRFAEDLQKSTPGAKLFKIQHHEAHIASAMVDHGISSDVIGVAFDGTGFGPDGAIWGGEFFTGNLKRFKRAAHFAYVPMPGGEAAIREPWRMAVSYLYCSAPGKMRSKISSGSPHLNGGYLRGINAKKLYALDQMINKKINSPHTSSVGRLFDAVGSIVFRRYVVSKEAELPIELEKIAAREWVDSYDFDIKKDKGMRIIDAAKMICGIIRDISKKNDVSIISGKFHNTIAEIILDTCMLIRKECSIASVILTGGVFQNKFLSERASYLLGERGFNVYRHSRIDTNDNGIPMGQIAIADARVLCV